MLTVTMPAPTTIYKETRHALEALAGNNAASARKVIQQHPHCAHGLGLVFHRFLLAPVAQ